MHKVVNSISKKAKARPVPLALEHITQHPGLQGRKLRKAVVEDYANAFRRGNVLPPVLVVRDKNDRFYLVDGYHRVEALRQLNGLDVIDAEIINGTFTDALWISWGANRNHGLRRSRDEIRRAIRSALKHPRWSKHSDRAIARHIGCDHKTVGAIRRYLAHPRGEFPKRPRALPSKKKILQACELLVRTYPDQLRAFSASEVAVVRKGYGSLSRLLVTQARVVPVGDSADAVHAAKRLQ